MPSRRKHPVPPIADTSSDEQTAGMETEGYDGGLSRGDRWGCATAAIVGLLVFMVLAFVDALGHCAPDTACRKGLLSMVLLPTAVAAGAAGLLVRFLVSRFGPKA